MRPRIALQLLGGVLLLAAFLMSVALMLIPPSASNDSQARTALAELLLVAVLSIEGIAAVAHLHEARRDRQVAALRELTKEWASKEVLEANQRLYKEIPWTTGPFHEIGETPLEWNWHTPAGTADVVYRVSLPDGSQRDVRVDVEDEIWWNINRIIERYQLAGLAYAYEHVSRTEFLSWAYLPVIRTWGRVAVLVEKERERRKSPELWQHFLALADAAREKRKHVLRK